MQTDHTTDLQIDHFERYGRHLRLAVVTETYPPEVNGVALTLHQIVQQMLIRQHSVQLIRLRQPADGASVAASPALADSGTLHPVEHEPPILMRGIPIPRYPGLRMGVPCKQALLKLWSVRRPDVVHIATEGPLGWSALRAAQQLKIPVSSDFRTNFHAYSRHYGVGVLFRTIMLILRKFHNRTDLTMVPTVGLKEELQKGGFKRLTVVGRGVDAGAFSPRHRSEDLRRQWGLGPQDLAVLVLGRVAAEKNIPLAVKAFEALAPRCPGARLVVVGDGPMRQALQAQLRDAVFTGMLRGVDLARCVASCDLFLFPSLTETFGNVVVEAMASGVPPVAFRMAAAADLVHSGVNGWTVMPGNEQAFIDAALQAATNADLRRSAAVRAQETVASLDWAVIARQFEQALMQLVDARQRLASAPAFSQTSWVGRS